MVVFPQRSTQTKPQSRLWLPHKAEDHYVSVWGFMYVVEPLPDIINALRWSRPHEHRPRRFRGLILMSKDTLEKPIGKNLPSVVWNNPEFYSSVGTYIRQNDQDVQSRRARFGGSLCSKKVKQDTGICVDRFVPAGGRLLGPNM